MIASAQRHDLKLKLRGLEAARIVGYQAPRAAGIVLPPAQPRSDPRRDALAAKIAQQLAGRPAQGVSTRERPFKPAPPARFPLSSLFDVPTLIVSLAATGLLVGSAFAMMILSGAVDAPGPEPVSPPEKPVAVLSASAAGASMTGTERPAPSADEPARIEAAAPQDSTPLGDIDAPAPDDGPGLFGDVRTVHRGDGQPGVEFGAIYDAPGSGAARSGAGETQAPVKEDLAEPQAGADAAEAKWIELPIALNLRRGPSRSAGIIGVVEKGSRLQEIERSRGWVKVIDPETSTTGWLYPDSAPKARRAAKQPTSPASQSEPASSGPFARLGNWLAKP